MKEWQAGLAEAAVLEIFSWLRDVAVSEIVRGSLPGSSYAGRPPIVPVALKRTKKAL